MSLTIGLLGFLGVAIGSVFQSTRALVVDFVGWFAQTSEIKAPFTARRAKIGDRYHAWHRAQMEAGVTVTTEAPTEVITAIQQVDRDERQALARFYTTHCDAPIEADLASRYERITPLLETLCSEFEALRERARQRAQLAQTCAVTLGASVVTIPEISDAMLIDWKARVARATAQPQKAAAPRRVPTALVLD